MEGCMILLIHSNLYRKHYSRDALLYSGNIVIDEQTLITFLQNFTLHGEETGNKKTHQQV